MWGGGSRAAGTGGGGGWGFWVGGLCVLGGLWCVGVGVLLGLVGGGWWCGGCVCCCWVGLWLLGGWGCGVGCWLVVVFLVWFVFCWLWFFGGVLVVGWCFGCWVLLCLVGFVLGFWFWGWGWVFGLLFVVVVCVCRGWVGWVWVGFVFFWWGCVGGGVFGCVCWVFWVVVG
ncbi:hypothetical protein, partial [Pseudomonas syringae group genomosp. 7]|uniref:hypothetical protein n=1 Tax=Pseudomonas syringae group genomosp. 7 TaxID=251699 RepID=UPI00376F70E4